MCCKKFANDSVWTTDLRFWKQLLCQLSHNHCPLHLFLVFAFPFPDGAFESRASNAQSINHVFCHFHFRGPRGKASPVRRVLLLLLPDHDHLSTGRRMTIESLTKCCTAPFESVQTSFSYLFRPYCWSFLVIPMFINCSAIYC